MSEATGTAEQPTGATPIDGDEFARRCRADGEFIMASRHWTGGLRLERGPDVIGVTLTDGRIEPGPPREGADGVITIAGEPEVWVDVAAAVPPPFRHDAATALRQGLERRSDELTWWQYAPAVQRAVELLGPDRPGAPVAATDRGPTPRFDAPVGRYVHLDLADGSGGESGGESHGDSDGDDTTTDHRIYFEEAGAGIPLLCQHTAGSNGVQWRHLFENPAITDHFRVIAYDLPYHGKSIPPVGPDWWNEPYRLTGGFLRSVPVALARALDLDGPVFIGCSVGGLLALDLALHHPDVFRAVISLEGALHIGGDHDRLTGFWDPRVSNETKARLMQGLTSPTSPLPYRKETVQAYAAGWPPAFLGDLWYYMVDYDLRERAAEIDTDRVGVHILSGEYDSSGTPAHGRAANEAILGSTFTEMAGVGHFPMSENPEAFFTYLEPVLDKIRSSP
ncbi:MAG: alpha/beta fold hydrolase [Actinomycetota bacterium]